MVCPGESAVKAVRLIRKLGASSDDGGAGEVPNVIGALRAAHRRTRRRCAAFIG
jgi:hypothetical protein